MRKHGIAFIAALLALSMGAVEAQQATETDVEGSWIHVRVDGEDGETAEINLPLAMADAAFQMGEMEGLDADDLRFGDDADVSAEQLRRVWRELRDVEDAELVNVRDGDEHVRIYKRDDRVHVQVDEDGREKVRIEVPSSIVDALLGSEGDRLDLAAAARELARLGDSEVVRIDDDEGNRIRVWVDQTSGGNGR